MRRRSSRTAHVEPGAGAADCRRQEHHRRHREPGASSAAPIRASCQQSHRSPHLSNDTVRDLRRHQCRCSESRPLTVNTLFGVCVLAAVEFRLVPRPLATGAAARGTTGGRIRPRPRRRRRATSSKLAPGSRGSADTGSAPGVCGTGAVRGRRAERDQPQLRMTSPELDGPIRRPRMPRSRMPRRVLVGRRGAPPPGQVGRHRAELRPAPLPRHPRAAASRRSG